MMPCSDLYRAGLTLITLTFKAMGDSVEKRLCDLVILSICGDQMSQGELKHLRFFFACV